VAQMIMIIALVVLGLGVTIILSTLLRRTRGNQAD
jgi:hypothetical protein